MSEIVDNVEAELSDVEEVVGNSFEDWEEQEETEKVQSLFCDTVLDSVNALIIHESEVHGFDLKQAVANVGCDDQSVIMLVNFIRSKVRAAASEINSMFINQINEELASKEFLKDDSNMIPVIPEDPLLYLLHDTLTNEDEDKEDEGDFSQSEAQVEAAKQQMRETLPNFNEISEIASQLL